MDKPNYNQEQIKLVFSLLKKDHFIDKSELLPELRDNLTIISLLERHTPKQVAEIIAEEFYAE
jgi:hypothetical protein